MDEKTKNDLTTEAPAQRQKTAATVPPTVPSEMVTVHAVGAAESTGYSRSPGPYIPGKSFKTWLELFTMFLEMKDVTDPKKQKLAFLAEIGESNYELLHSLLKGKQPKDEDYSTLTSLLEKHFEPKKLVMSERFRMLSLTQQPGQSLQDFYAGIQHAANTCAWEKIDSAAKFRDAIVLMTFLAGMRSVDTRKRILESPKDLSS